MMTSAAANRRRSTCKMSRIGRAAGRGDHADARGLAGRGRFSSAAEQPFLRQFVAQLLECALQRTGPLPPCARPATGSRRAAHKARPAPAPAPACPPDRLESHRRDCAAGTSRSAPGHRGLSARNTSGRRPDATNWRFRPQPIGRRIPGSAAVGPRDSAARRCKRRVRAGGRRDFGGQLGMGGRHAGRYF